ncbi:MAG: hypothetical protein V3S38_00305 [Acidimicrobiia bacterium]
MENALSPTQNVAVNVRTFMTWRNLTQKEVAERMNEAGLDPGSGRATRWYAKTVSHVLSGSRRLSVDELYLLALALETSVAALLTPDISSRSETVSFPRREYRIGAMSSIDRESFEHLLDIPTPPEPRPVVGVSWALRDPAGGPPVWKSKITHSLMDAISEALAVSGWRSLDEFFEKHLDAKAKPFIDLAAYIRRNPADRTAEEDAEP